MAARSKTTTTMLPIVIMQFAETPSTRSLERANAPLQLPKQIRKATKNNDYNNNTTIGHQLTINQQTRNTNKKPT